MAQSFRHVLRGMTPAEVEAYAAAHRKRWWQGRHLMIQVEDGRIKAARPASRSSQPPVLRGTLRPTRDGTLVVGELRRGASAGVNAVFAFVAALAVVVAVVGLVGGAPVVGLGGIVVAVLFVMLFVGLVTSGRAAQEAEADELRGALNQFFGTRP